MLLLAGYPRVVFLGQSVAYDGTAMFRHLDGVPDAQRIEMPVAEELQTGIATGLALQGFLPISIYPRMDFLMRAMDQLVNHLDKFHELTEGQWRPKVILRTRRGQKTPLDAGPQHTQDHTLALRAMLTGRKGIRIIRISHQGQILRLYDAAYRMPGSVLVVEDF